MSTNNRGKRARGKRRWSRKMTVRSWSPKGRVSKLMSNLEAAMAFRGADR